MSHSEAALLCSLVWLGLLNWHGVEATRDRFETSAASGPQVVTRGVVCCVFACLIGGSERFELVDAHSLDLLIRSHQSCISR